MTSPTAWYSLLQVCPDDARDERVNVGVVLIVPDRGFVGARVDQEMARAEKLFKSEQSVPSLAAAAQSVAERLRRWPDVLDSKALAEYGSRLGNAIRLTTPRGVRSNDPAATLQSLFDEFLSPCPVLQRHKTRLPRIIERALVEIGFRHNVFRDYKFSLTSLDKVIHSPLAYQNGQVTMVKVCRLDRGHAKAIDAAIKIAGEGLLVKMEHNPGGTETRVVAVPESESPSPEVEVAVVEAFSKFGTDYIRSVDLGGFATQLQDDIRSHG